MYAKREPRLHAPPSTPKIPESIRESAPNPQSKLASAGALLQVPASTHFRYDSLRPAVYVSGDNRSVWARSMFLIFQEMVVAVVFAVSAVSAADILMSLLKAVGLF